MRKYLKGTEPEYCRDYTESYFTRIGKEYPTGSIDVLGKMQLCEAEGLAYRLGYDDAFAMFEAYGFKCKQSNGKPTRIAPLKERGFYNITMSAFIPHKEQREVFQYPIHACYGDETYAEVEHSRSEIDTAIDQYRDLLSKAEKTASTAGIENSPARMIGKIHINNAWFNRRTDIAMLKILTHELELIYPYRTFLYHPQYKNGFDCYECYDSNIDHGFSVMVLTALFVYPGSDIIWELIPRDILQLIYASEGLERRLVFENYIRDRKEYTYLIVNSDTGVRIETFQGKYPYCPTDKAEKEYNRLIKKPCTDDYIEFRMENRSGFIRVPKEIIDGRVCIDGVPLDLYECVRFDSEQNAYIIMNLPKYDMPLPLSKIHRYTISWDLPDFTWDNRLIPTKDSKIYDSFPGIPRVDALHHFLNRMEPTHSKFMMEDLEAIIHVIETPQTGNSVVDNMIIETDRGERYTVIKSLNELSIRAERKIKRKTFWYLNEKPNEWMLNL